MLEAKEQAKYYIDKIRSIGKATNQTLLIVFVPLTFLWITGIENKYIVAAKYIRDKESVDKLRGEVENNQKEIVNINKSITAYLRDTAIIQFTDSSKVQNNIKEKKENRYKIQQNIKEGDKKNYIFNDSIKNNLDKLQIPVTLPILNVKVENLYFKYIIFVVMIFYCMMLLYAYLMKKKL